MATKPEDTNPFAKYLEAPKEEAPAVNPFAKYLEERTAGEALVTDPISSLLKGAGTMLSSPAQIGRLVTGDKPSEEKPKGTIESLMDTLLPFGSKPSEIPEKALQKLTPTAPTVTGVTQNTLAPFSGLQPVGEELQAYGQKQKSAGLQASEKNLADKINAANGFFNEAGEAIGGTLTNPALLSSFIFEQMPNMVGTLGGGALTKQAFKSLFADATEKTLARAGVTGAVTTAAAMQGGDIGAETYQSIYDQMIKSNMTPEQAHEIALQKGRIAAAQAAALSVASTFIPGGKALEKRFLGEAAKKSGKASLASKIGNVIGETTQEGVEEGGGKLISNLQVADLFPDTDVMKGVGAATGQGALGGGLFGGISNIPSRQVAPGETPPPTPEDAAPVPPISGGPAAPTDLSRAIPEDQIATEDTLTPVSPSVEVTPPAAEPKQLDQIITRLDELEAEFKAIDDAYATATPDQFGPMTTRQGQIKTEMSKLIQAGTTGAPIETVTPPAAPVAEEVITPTEVAPPAEPVETGPLKRLSPAEALLKRLKPEFVQEYDQLKQQYQQLAGQPETPENNLQKEQLLTRIDEIATNKDYRKPMFEKVANDPAIEKEGIDLADQLEKLGDTASADGLRTNIEKRGGFTEAKNLDYYKGKLLEAQQKVGKADEMPKEKLVLSDYMGKEDDKDFKRLEEFVNKSTYYDKLKREVQAGEDVRNAVSKTNEYLQKITDRINELGYKALGNEFDAPKEVQDLRTKLSQIAGTTNRLVKDEETIVKELKTKNWQKRPQSKISQLKLLDKDYAEIDKIIGKEAITPKEELSLKGLQLQNRFVDAEKSGKLTKQQANAIFNLINNNKNEEAETRLNNILRRQEKVAAAPKAEEAVTAPPVEAKKTQTEINRERQEEKKAKVEKVAKPQTERQLKSEVKKEVKAEIEAGLPEPTVAREKEIAAESKDVANQIEKFNATDFTYPTASSYTELGGKNVKADVSMGEYYYKLAARLFLESPLKAKVPTKKANKLNVKGVEGVMPMPIVKTVKALPPTYVNQKKVLETIAAKSDVRYYLNGTYIDKDKNRLVATDGHRLLAINNANFDGAPAVKKGEDVVSREGKIIVGSYPDVDRVIPKEHYENVTPTNIVKLADYARGVSKGWRYVSNDNPIILDINGDKAGFNADYIVDMADAFRALGYETASISIKDQRLYATSPDGKVQQVVMGMRDPSKLFTAAAIGKKKVANQPETIDVEATEITEEQIMLLTDETSKLSKTEMATLETHYGFSSDTDKFFQALREDIIKYVNKGADAVDAAIRDIIKKLQAGVLAVAVVFNPAFMSEQSTVVYPTVVQQVSAPIPDAAKSMSEGAKKAYATLYPALQQEMQQKNKYFTVVDKPASKVYVFNPDGSLMTQSNVVLGKALGDVYVGQTQFKQNQITPAGVIKAKAEKGSATYDGKTVYTFGNVKEGWSAVFMHTVYLKESDAEARKKALATGEGTRLSHGCVNGPAEFMAKIDNESMDGSHVFIVPDNQTLVDDYIANNVSNEDLTRETIAPKTVEVPSKEGKPAGKVELAGREEKAIEKKTQAEINRDRQLDKLAKREKPLDKPYYNDFTSNIDYNELYKRAELSREDRIKEYAQVRAASRRALKQVAKYGSDIPMQRQLNELLDKEEMLKAAVSINKPKRDSAADFMAKATKEMAAENLEPEVEAVIRQVYEKYPGVLEGLRLSLRTRAIGDGSAGNFNPYARIVTLWKDSSGVDNPATIRHELTHSLEQMMTPEAKQALVEAWARAFENAIKRHKDEKSQEFFNKVLDFLDRPSKDSFDAATRVMPSYDFYQYMNPSEYWAVNAEKLFAAKLGTPWARFVSAVKKLVQAMKSVFGFDNTFAVHRAFDNLMNGNLERTKDENMLVDYLLQGKVKIDFLNSVEDIQALIKKHNRPAPKMHPSDSVVDKLLGGYRSAKKMRERVAANPLLEASNMVGRVDRATTYARNKNVFFGTGLQLADFAKYGGQIRNGLGQAIASLAVANAIKAGHVGTQVMIQGKLVFDTAKQQFGAVKDSMSMANVIIEKNKLVKQLGEEFANYVIQGYFEAKRSRSIVNEYLDREAAYEMAVEAGEDPVDAAKNLKGIEIALEKVNMDDEAISDFIALEKEYPELRKMMDNWTAVNHNMLDMMQFSGVISKKRADHLKSIKDYVPWYRIMDEQTDVHTPTAAAVRTLTNVGQEKKLKAGKTDRGIDDIVDNMIHNVMMMTRNSMRNHAANAVVMEYGERHTEGKQKGKLRVFPQEGTDADGVRMNIIANGRRIIVRIKDPLVAESVIGMENIQIPMNDILAYFANGLRRSITFSGIFQLKQLFMDAPTAAWVSGVKSPFKVWGGTFSSFLKALKKDDPIVDMFKSFGIGGFQSTSRTPEKELKIEIGLLDNSAFSKVIKFLDHVGDSSDYAQRRAVYKQVLKETGDEMLALFQANNVIDFNKRGSGDTAQFLTRTVSFMNAYAQQLDVLAQTFAGGGLKGKSRREAFIQMRNTGMMLASVSLLYAMAVGADDDYWELDDQTRLRSIYIPFSKKYLGHHVVLPMHTSASFFFKAMPELLYNTIITQGTKNEIDRTRLLRAMGKAAVDALLSPNVTPTGIKPFAEIALDRNFFTGGTVVPRGMEDLDAAEQYNANTSELGKVMSALTGRVLNPIEADHLMRGLGGSVAAMAMWGSNLFAGDRPEGRVKDIPIIGQFVLPEVPRLKEDLYYDLKDRSDEAYATYMKKIEREKFDEADKYYDKNEDLIATHDYVTGLEAALKNVNKQIRMVGEVSTKDMSKSEKREEITDLQKQKNEMLDDVIQIRKDAGL